MELAHIGSKFRRTFYKWNMSLCTISDVIALCYGSLSCVINVDIYHIYIYANIYMYVLPKHIVLNITAVQISGSCKRNGSGFFMLSRV